MTNPNPNGPTQGTGTPVASDFKGVSCNGQLVTSAVEIQTHITNLETRNTELATKVADAAKAERKAFVAQLAADKKISAAQMGSAEAPGLEAFALSLPDDAYEAWKATWATAPVVPALAPHGGTLANAATVPVDKPNIGVKTGTPEDQNEIDMEIVRSHRAGRMDEAVLAQTPSYQRLKAQNLI